MSLTKHMFNPIQPAVIILVATMIRHGIDEFKHGSRHPMKFEGHLVESTLLQDVQKGFDRTDNVDTEPYEQIKKL